MPEILDIASLASEAEWKTAQGSMEAFALASESGAAGSGLRARPRAWITDQTLVRGLVDSVRIAEFQDERLSADPTPLLLFRTGHRVHAVRIAAATETQDGHVLFADGIAPATPDLKRVLALAYGLQRYTVFTTW